jgi:hypothetical protein
MVTLTHNLESGQASGTTITTANSAVGGNAFDTTTIGSGTGLTYNSTALRGTRSLLATSGATAAAVSANWTTSIGSISRIFVRFLFRRGSASSVSQVMCRVRGSGTQNFRITLDTDNTVTLRNSTSSFLTRSVGATNTTDTWMLRADITVGASATGVLYVHYNPLSATPDETLTVNNANFATANANEVNWGLAIAVANSTMRLDDLIITDVALPGPPENVIVVGQTTEIDASQSVSRRKQLVASQGNTTDVSQTVRRVKVRAVQAATETNIATTITRRKLRVIAAAAEIDIPQAVRQLKMRIVAQAATVATAGSIARQKRLGVAGTAETSQPAASARRKSRLVGDAVESDAALGVGARKARGILSATDTSQSQPVTGRKTRLVGGTAETDTAAAVGQPTAIVVPVDPAFESDVAQSVRAVKRLIVQQATIAEVASQIIAARKLRRVTPAFEFDLAAPLLLPAPEQVELPELAATIELLRNSAAIVVRRPAQTTNVSASAGTKSGVTTRIVDEKLTGELRPK